MMNENEKSAKALLHSLGENYDFEFKEKYVLPGESVGSSINSSSSIGKKIILSKGLSKSDGFEDIAVSIPGVLKYHAPSTYYVESKSHFYNPMTGDQIVGVIEEKNMEFYKVNIFNGPPALLSTSSL
jgi:exosome complex RNA-binding protein Rrp4